FGFNAMAVIGASTRPRASAPLAHSAIRSIEAGSAEAMPTALPWARASASSLASAWSMLAAGGTAPGRSRGECGLGLGERQVVGAGDLAGHAARRGAVVDEDQPTLGGLFQHRS